LVLYYYLFFAKQKKKIAYFSFCVFCAGDMLRRQRQELCKLAQMPPIIENIPQKRGFFRMSAG
ncbi:MAG: hypothetical protein J7J32_06530, partial [Candidatus Atribacteria bacterium]|nr:hypothetical protein [Candidatus Atribacteria bacterium]MCD6350256.1 hypothetical protein [Candidatus Atribacteria bacterium]